MNYRNVATLRAPGDKIEQKDLELVTDLQAGPCHPVIRAAQVGVLRVRDLR